MSGVGQPYRCALCLGIFTKTQTDEAAAAEAKALWAEDIEDGDAEIVCDDCFQNVLAWALESEPQFLTDEARKKEMRS